MLGDYLNFKKFDVIVVILISLFAILLSGLFFGISYFVMDQIGTAFESTDCIIEGNLYVETCQELWSLSIYPILALKEVFVWFSFFFIFALVSGILVLGYQSGRSPVLLGVLVIIVGIISYLAIEVSNIYRTLLENEMFRNMVIEFTVYNKIMLYFPWFIFIITLFAVILGIVNWQKAPINTSRDELDY